MEREIMQKKNITISIPDERQFKRHKNAHKRKERAKEAIEVVLSIKKLHVSVKKDVLRKLLYAWTQAEPQNRHATKFQSDGAMSKIHARGSLVHEHVRTRKSVVAELMKKQSDKKAIAKILNSTIACTITRDEDNALRVSDNKFKHNKQHNGKTRYKKAGIDVYNVTTGKKAW